MRKRMILVAIAIVLVAIVVTVVILALGDSEPKPNILILMDTSAAMDESFEDGTKIEVAVATINELVATVEDSDLSHLALRRYGGPAKGIILNSFSRSKGKTETRFRMA